VCIVNWNCHTLLRDCLLSLRQAQDVRLEVIVVDNGSTDGAPEMVARDFPEVVLLRNDDNCSFSRANNQAARRARGRYLFFLNNDTLVPPVALRSLLAYAQTHPEAGVIGPCLRNAAGRVQTSWRLRPSVRVLLHRLVWLRWTGLFRRAYHGYRCRSFAPQAPGPVEVLMGAALFMPRRVFLEYGSWDEDYTFGGEDIDLCTRIGRRAPVIYHPDIAITHFGRVSSRQRIGYAHCNTLIGVTRYLRKNGCSRLGLGFYKLALTVDAPLQWLAHAGEYLWRRLRGQPARAAKSRRVLQALSHFLSRGLVQLWKV
jgi:GT2 family glycosyltransferase